MNHSSGRIVFLTILLIMVFCVACKDKSPPMASSDEAMKWADETLAALTLEEKISQIICVDIAGGYITEDDPKLKQWVRLARDYGIGSFVLYGGTPRDVAHLLNRLQMESELKILMSVDFYG
ncbi:MAG: hypothetical protein ABIL68_05340 [bacterium]